MSVKDELLECIIRDYDTLNLTDDEIHPNRNFYHERIAEYTDELRSLMTLQEELFAEFFNKHINILHPWVKDMNVLEIRAYRERMALIAKEGKAAVYAADEAEKEVLKAKGINGPKGFERSVNTDEFTTDAINTIKDRQKKLTKQEKIQAGLEKLGISSTDAAKLMSAGTILGRLKQKVEIQPEEVKSAEDESKPVFNPFDKKKEE